MSKVFLILFQEYLMAKKDMNYNMFHVQPIDWSDGSSANPPMPQALHSQDDESEHQHLGLTICQSLQSQYVMEYTGVVKNCIFWIFACHLVLFLINMDLPEPMYAIAIGYTLSTSSSTQYVKI